MIAYKLFRVLKDGSLHSLFINKKTTLPTGQWIDAESHPTEGYKYRPFWHCTSTPNAPHLSMNGRAWYKVEIDEMTEHERPSSQGGTWYLTNRIKILSPA